MTALYKPNGDGFDIAPAGVMILMATYALEKEAPARFAGIVKDMLAAARAGGYLQAEVLETLLLRNGENSQRVRDMAVAACEAAGPTAIGKIFDAMRSGVK